MVDFLFLLNALLALMASSACFYVQRKILSADHTMQNSSTVYIHFKKLIKYQGAFHAARPEDLRYGVSFLVSMAVWS